VAATSKTTAYGIHVVAEMTRNPNRAMGAATIFVDPVETP